MNRRIYEFFDSLLLPHNLVLVASVSFAVIFFISFQAFKGFHSFETMPSIKTVAGKWEVDPVSVTVGMYVNNVIESSYIHDKFEFDLTVWFEFDSSRFSLEKIGNFTFENGEVLHRSEPYIRTDGNKKLASYDMHVRFKFHLVYPMFPFDDHTLNMIISNRSVLPSDMWYKSNRTLFAMSDMLRLPGWSVFDTRVTTGYDEMILEKDDPKKNLSYPTVVFSIDVRRGVTKSIFLILLPLLLVYFLSMFSFTFDPGRQRANTVLSLMAVTGGTLVSYRFIIENLSPSVGYFMFSDNLFMLMLAVVVIEFVITIQAIRYKKLSPTYKLVRGIIFLAINIMMPIMWYYFLYPVFR